MDVDDANKPHKVIYMANISQIVLSTGASTTKTLFARMMELGNQAIFRSNEATALNEVVAGYYFRQNATVRKGQAKLTVPIEKLDGSGAVVNSGNILITYQVDAPKWATNAQIDEACAMGEDMTAEQAIVRDIVKRGETPWA